MSSLPRRELILYATPTGELAEQCDRLFEEATRIGPTEAQTYPPHCTLTGFFHRRRERADEIAAQLQQRLADLAVPHRAVEVVALRCGTEWIGLELRSTWLESTTRELFADHALDADDDPIRVKTDLHLSLAYDLVPLRRDLSRDPSRDLAPYARCSVELVDPAADAGWELALWERDGSDWHRLTS